MDIEQRDGIIDGLCALSDRQFDPEAKRRIAKVMGRDGDEARDDLLAILDMCWDEQLCGSSELEVMKGLVTGMDGGEAIFQMRKADSDDEDEDEEARNERWRRLGES